MKEFLGRIKADFLLSSVLCIALGLVFIIWRASVLTIVANVLAVVLIIIGVVYMCSYFLNIVTNGFSAMLGLVVLAVGIWFLVQPKVVVSLIPIVIGLVLIFHSIRSIIEAVDARKYGYGGWSVGLIFSIISLIFGIICVTNAFDEDSHCCCRYHTDFQRSIKYLDYKPCYKGGERLQQAKGV